jgi:large conductance mechanosensitive channel
MDPRSTFAGLEPAGKKAFSLLEEFKNFALKGNMIDLAVGVIIGAAFGAVVKSLVSNVMMPLIGALVSLTGANEQGYQTWIVHLHGQNDVNVGLFLGEIANFLFVALALFIFIQKFLGFVLRTKRQEAAEPPPPTRDQELLMEIRDLLRQKQAG